MLKQALSRSPIFDEQSSIHQNEEEQHKEGDDAIKTSLLTQILTSSQRSSNKPEHQEEEATVRPFQNENQGTEPRFLDETEDNRTKKLKKMAFEPNNSLLHLQVKAQMQMDYSKMSKGEKKTRNNIPNCTGECLIY